jgi:hypothetical protein
MSDERTKLISIAGRAAQLGLALNNALKQHADQLDDIVKNNLNEIAESVVASCVYI